MGKAAKLLVVAAIATSGAPIVANAAGATPAIRASDDLSTPVTFTGSGDTASTSRTNQLRDLVPPSSPRIFVLGTGVARGLFPASVASVVSGVGSDLVDPHGYGTLAASTILQLSPGARITSRAIRSADAGWNLIDLSSLADALEAAYADRANQDAVLLAFPPNGALDPLSNLIGHADYGAFGKGDGLLAEAILASRAPAQTRGIPLDDSLRDKIFEGTNDRQRDAVERYVKRVRAWDRVTSSVRALTDAGVAVIAPTGDFTRRGSDGSLIPLPHQTIFGVAALPEVITVGAAYTEGPAALGKWRVSPTSGRGPTLSLDTKPDLVASSDVVGMLPASSGLAWPDDSTRVPGGLIAWAQPGVTPSPCPSPTRAYRCAQQASSMISAAVVATNLAASVNRGVPRYANARTASDDEILRGLAWAAASATPALASKGSPASLPSTNGTKPLPAGDQEASVFEQGVGVLTGLRYLDLEEQPIALRRGTIGEVGFSGASRSVSVPVWDGATPVRGMSASITDRLGPDVSGRAVRSDVPGGLVSASATPSADPSLPADRAVRLAVPAVPRAGGVYTGTTALTGPSGAITLVPTSFTQNLPFEFHADYAYNELMADGLEGERVEDASVILMAGLPAGIGLVGEAFKSLSGPIERRLGGDPAHNIILRTGRAKNTFTDPGLAPNEHGRGKIEGVPPGFYRFHLLTDNRVEATQEDGTPESLGIGLGSFGPDGLSSPSQAILIPGDGPCDSGAPAPCSSRDSITTSVDERTGFCEASNAATKVRFGVYCGEVAYAVPSAVVTRAAHLFERSEWEACSVSLTPDGSVLSFTGLVERARGCEASPIAPLGGSAPTIPGTAWKVGPGSPSCLAPNERSRFPSGNPSDLTASFQATQSGFVGDKVPALVLTTEVPLPYLNTYTTATMTLAYEAEGAIIATRFDAGPDRTADASHSILTIAGTGVSVPGKTPAQARGVYEDEWAIMSANQPAARLSILVFPTNATRDASVSLCDVALRVSTFAKQSWGDRVGGNLRSFPVLDRGLTDMIDPARTRIRASFRDGGFTDLASQRESLVVATQAPRNTTRDPNSDHRVRSPWGGPATPAAVRRWGTDARRYEEIAGADLIDAKGRSTSLACTSAEPTCKAWNAARSANQVLSALTPDLVVNGRFFGYRVAREAQLVAAQGNLAFDTAMATQGSPAWAPGQRVSVSTFPTSASESATAGPLDPAVQILRDPAGRAVLRILGTLPGGTPLTGSVVLG